MGLKMEVTYDVDDTDAETEKILEEIVGDETRAFIENVRQSLSAAGVTDINMNLSEARA